MISASTQQSAPSTHLWGLPRRLVMLALTAGVLAGVFYSLSPLTFLSVVWIAALMFVAGRGLPDSERRLLRAVLFAAIATRALVVVVLMLMTAADNQSAGILFGDEGYLLRRSWRLRNVWLGIPGTPYDYINAFEDYARTGYQSLVSYLQVLLGRSPYSLRLLNAAVFVTASYLLHRLARRSFGPAPAMIGLIIVLFLPTQFSWSISLLKESAYLLATVATLLATARLMRASSWASRVAWAVAVVCAVMLIAPFRPQGVALMSASLMLTFGLWWATQRFRRALVVAVCAPFVLWMLLQQPTVHAAVTKRVGGFVRMHAGHAFTIGHAYKTMDDYAYTLPTFFSWEQTPDETGRFIFRSIRAFLLVPLPWQAESTLELAYLPEQMAWYLLALLAMVGVFKAFRQEPFVTCLLLGHVLVSSAAVALTSGNVGTLIRHRSLSIPFLVWFSAVGLVWVLERVTDKPVNESGPAR